MNFYSVATLVGIRSRHETGIPLFIKGLRVTFDTSARVDRRKPRSRRLSARAIVQAIDGTERPYPGYLFSNRQFFDRPRANPFAGADFAITSITPQITSPVVNQPYTFQLASEGGTAPVTWALTSGLLPVGFVLSGAGLISGTPTIAGLASFVVTATDSSAVPMTTARALALQVNP